MKSIELNGYKIEFYSEEEWNEPIDFDNGWGTIGENIIQYQEEHNQDYIGLVNEISEELCEKIVKKDMNFCESTNCNDILYINYQTKRHNLFNSKQSFKTLSELEYCIISKI